jgi:diaminohydroxyphosphoribosylaminopyrimidine deaminase/5-amino-6-(5-phosphoribosylamino)uracil reductase
MEQEHFMQRALSLAKLGLGKVKTNPMVGCVIVKNNAIISEGFHQNFGEAHAEVNALKDLQQEDITDSEAFVSLEPCSHFGKTPPCADLLIESGIKKVTIAMLDPNPLVAGNGVKKLKDNRIEVHVGMLEKEALALNPVFLHGIKTKTPFITLKWAESKDGFISGHQGSEKISGLETDLISHQFRTEVDAICVGSTTILKDQPKLDTRLVSDEKKLKVSFGNSQHPGYIALHPDSFDTDLKDLYSKHNIGHLLVEGGQKTLQYFIDHQAFQQVRIIRSKTKQFESGTQAPTINYNQLKLQKEIETAVDNLYIYKPC